MLSLFLRPTAQKKKKVSFQNITAHWQCTWVIQELWQRWTTILMFFASLLTHMHGAFLVVGEESTCNAGDPGSIPGLGRSTGEGIGYSLHDLWASLVAQLVKNLPAMRETWVGKIPWRREWLPTPVFWPGEFLGPYSPWGRKELDMTEWLSLSPHIHFASHGSRSHFNFQILLYKKYILGASLVTQWQRICLPIQETHGVNPWYGKMPHAMKQLIPCATTTEPVL